MESSHRSLHDFEISIIRRFEDKSIKTQPGFIFKNKKPQKITVTYLDIGMQQLRHSKMIEKEKFTRQSSTKVVVSEYDGKLFLFENEHDGIYLGDALCQGQSEKPKSNKTKARIKASEIDRIIFFLQEKNM